MLYSISPAFIHHIGLGVSQAHHRRSEQHAQAGDHKRALVEKTKAVIVYDRTVTHWSMAASDLNIPVALSGARR